jgi:hypothetical protein
MLSGPSAAERERRRIERDGINTSVLLRCDAVEADGTLMAGLVKTYVPIDYVPRLTVPSGSCSPLAPTRTGAVCLELVAFGERHPRPTTRSVYERAHSVGQRSVAQQPVVALRLPPWTDGSAGAGVRYVDYALPGGTHCGQTSACEDPPRTLNKLPPSGHMTPAARPSAAQRRLGAIGCEAVKWFCRIGDRERRGRRFVRTPVPPAHLCRAALGT